jgi:hypothetical protein
MAAIKSALEKYNSKRSLLESVFSVLMDISKLLDFYVDDHIRPVAKRLDYDVEVIKDTCLSLSLGIGSHNFFKRVSLTKGKGYIIVDVGVNQVELYCGKYPCETCGGALTKTELMSYRKIDLQDPTFSLMEAIKNYELGHPITQQKKQHTKKTKK